MLVSRPDWGRRLGALSLGCALLAACKVNPPAAGGLVLSLETDLAAPKDIDRVRLEVTQDGERIRLDDQPIGSGHTLLPSEVRLTYPGNDKPLLIRATAFRGAEPRIERSSVTNVPRTWLGLVRVPLSFLCDGTALPEGGSSCGEGNTCNQGTCGSAQVPPDALPRYEPGNEKRTDAVRAAADAGLLTNDLGVAARSGCFDVAACFADAQVLDIDVSTCSIALPPPAAGMLISLALVLPLGNAGICENGACFVTLDRDSGSYSFGDAGEVLLPEGVCNKLRGSLPLRAAISSRCGEKTSQNPPCGPWSSVQSPLPVIDIGASDSSTSSAPSLLGGACSGPGREACGKCGTRARGCQEGQWQAWGECLGEGTCTPGETSVCGAFGTRTCGGNCEWGACLTQTCNGPSSQACGNCGTQTRSCDNGEWSAWSACGGQGECKPNDTRDCGVNGSGTQACGGNCRWGSCGDQSCVGAPSEACGNCGSHTRGCNAATGAWSMFGECTDQGECTPDTTRDCGTGGKRACRGDCRYDAVCAGQTCIGESTRPCERCGTQTRACDTNTGMWGVWSACSGQGECTPNEMRACGAANSGTRVCGGNCRWDDACSGQSCAGVARQSCGHCGSQTRTCDSNTGTWSSFSACMNEGACEPGDTRMCGVSNSGTRTCNPSCQWSEACSMQSCSGPALQACGNCGTQTRTCDPSSGQFGAWSTCTGEKTCAAGDTRACGGSGTLTCGVDCEWGAICDCPAGQHLCNGRCVSNADVNSCGDSCSPCAAPIGGTATCTAGRCGTSCGALTQCGSSCIDTRTDAAHCGDCTTTCGRGESCVAGRCACPAGQHRCSGRCVSNDDPATCGDACTACGAPAGANATCDGRTCSFSCAAGSMCKNACVDLSSDNNNCGTCGNVCTAGRTCQSGQCLCPRSTHECNGGCVKNDSPATCGESSCTPCPTPAIGRAGCDGTKCVNVCENGLHMCPDGSCAADTDPTRCGPGCDMCPAIANGAPLCAGALCDAQCNPGWTKCYPPIGLALPYCVNAQIDPSHCGQCFKACDPGLEVCYKGECIDREIN